MPQFRKKPVVIEAHHFTGWNDDNDPIFDTDPSGWLLSAMHADVVSWETHQTLIIYTLEGLHKASVGDWIIKGVKGELYPCKPDIFAATYEPVESSPSDPQTTYSA